MFCRYCGSHIADDSVIESGVKPGEVVVTDGQLRLVPGAKVKVRNGEANQKPMAMAQVEGKGRARHNVTVTADGTATLSLKLSDAPPPGRGGRAPANAQ